MNKQQIASLELQISYLFIDTKVQDIRVTEVTPQYRKEEYRVFIDYELPNGKVGMDNIYCTIQLFDTDVSFKPL